MMIPLTILGDIADNTGTFLLEVLKSEPKKGALLIKATQRDNNPESRYPTCNMWQFLLAVLEKVDNANWVLPTSIQTEGKCMCTVKKICACIWDKCDQG